MTLTGKLQKLTVLAFILVIATSVVFSVTLALTSEEMPAGGRVAEDSPLAKKALKLGHLDDKVQFEDTEDTTMVASQSELLPYMWNAVLGSFGLLIISILALVWDAHRKGKINIVEALDLDHREEIAKD